MSATGIIPLVIGSSLIYLGWSGGRTANLVFGHALVVTGCYLITWGFYLLPHAKPNPLHIIVYPLFWGFITLLGGICAIFHGFCNCIIKKEIMRERKFEALNQTDAKQY